jgi:hypothetical protein
MRQRISPVYGEQQGQCTLKTCLYAVCPKSKLGIAFNIPDEWEMGEARLGSDAFFTVQDAAGIRQSALRFTIVEADPITLTRFIESVRSGAWGPYIRSVQPMRMGELDALRLELTPGDDRPPLVWFVACPSGLVVSFSPGSDPTLAESALRTLRAVPVKDRTDPSIQPTPMVKPTWITTTMVISTPAALYPGWESYASQKHHVTLQYPSAWQLIPDYWDERRGGADGFFALDVPGRLDWTLDKLCDRETDHHLLPFGSRPQIERVQLQGQAACLIWPSEDSSTKGEAALIVSYPAPVQIEGVRYGYLRLLADTAHIREIASTLKFMTVPTPVPLLVEEYPIVAAGVYTPDRMEYTQLISPTILARRSEWRGYRAAKQTANANEVLARFGYRLAPTPGSFYDLYHGNDLIQSEVREIGWVMVNGRGDDFALSLTNRRGADFVLRPAGLEPWSRYAYTRPVLVGSDLVAAEIDPQWKQVTVRRGNKMSASVPVPGPQVDNPVKGLWAWEGKWVLEINGDVLVEGASWKEMSGYDEVFGWQLLNEQPFYFFRQGNRVGVSYAGQVLPYQYDEVIHYQCCEPAMFNVGSNENMVWFHALRDGMWYYVEMGVYE